MLASFQPTRLQQARYLSRMTLEELGRRIDVKRQSLSQFEKGDRSPSPETLAKMSRELKVPVEFFLRPIGRLEGSGHSVILYRSLKRTRDVIKEQQRSAAILDLGAALTDSLEEHIEYSPANVPRIDQSIDVLSLQMEDIDEIAAKTRRDLGLGDGPISDVTLLVENQSVIVVHAPLPEGMDGMSAWYAERPFIVVSSTATYARGRLSLAHEFGHLVLHQEIHEESQLDDKTFDLIEAQAWRFAGAFLLPAKSFLAETYNSSLNALALLKPKWGVSIGGMIKRLEDLTVLNKDQVRYLSIEMRRRNWHRKEPGDDVPREKARLLNKSAAFLADSGEMPFHEFAAECRLPPQFLAPALEVSQGELLPPPPKNVVQFRLKESTD